MLNLNMVSHDMPNAQDDRIRRTEYETYLDRTVAVAVDAIGAGMDVKADVLIGTAFPFVVEAVRGVASKGAVGKGDGVKKDDLIARILVGLTLKGRDVFRGVSSAVFIFDSLGNARSNAGIALELGRGKKIGKLKYKTEIDDFLRAVGDLVILAGNPANRGLRNGCFGVSPDQAMVFDAYKKFAAPLALQVMLQAKKAKKATTSTVKTFADKVEDFLSRQEKDDSALLTAMDYSEAITILEKRHNAMVASENEAMTVIAPTNENVEPELLTGTNG